MPMADIDRMEYGLYMQIIRERAQRRATARENEGIVADHSVPGDVVMLHRGFIDEMW